MGSAHHKRYDVPWQPQPAQGWWLRARRTSEEAGVIQKVLATIGLVICLVMLVRMTLAPRRRQAFDAAWRRATHGLYDTAQRLLHWRPAARKNAARAAEEAIERARRQAVDREGNVYRPKSFKGPRKPH